MQCVQGTVRTVSSGRAVNKLSTDTPFSRLLFFRDGVKIQGFLHQIGIFVYVLVWCFTRSCLSSPDHQLLS